MKTLRKAERMLRDYLESLRVRAFSPSTLRSREAALHRFFARLEKKDIRAITRADVQAYAAVLMAELEPSSTRVHLAGLHSFFAWLEATEAMLVNPCVGVPLPKRPDRWPRRVLTAAEAEKILAQPDPRTHQGKRDRALLELLYSSGLRLAEVSALALHDLDLTCGLVRVNRGKGGRGRVAPLGATAVEALRAYLDTRRVWLEKRGQAEAALWLSPIKPHGPLQKEAVALTVRRCAQRAGVGVVGPHVWRHTCATHLVRDGAGVVYVQRLLGHRSLATTQIYARVTATDVRAMMRQSHPRL